MAIEVRDYRPRSDAAAVSDLWNRVLGGPAGGQTVEWLFRPGPAGENPRVVAEDGGRIVAHAGAMALRFLVDGEEVRGGYSVAAMTDPAWRGQRLFFRVGEQLYRRMEEEGFALVAGFSNRNSVRLMTGPLRRTPLRPFPWCAKVLRPLALAGALLGRRTAMRGAPRPPRASEAGVEVVACLPDDSRLDAVWVRAAERKAVSVVRDTAFAAWRYGTRPDAGYRLLVAQRSGEPVGWSAWRFLVLRGIPTGFLVDLVVAGDEEGAGAALLAAVEAEARRAGAALMSALLPGGGPAREALRRSGYWRVPERMHPQVICFSVRALGRFAARPSLVDPRAWRLAWADTDVV